MAHCSLKVWGLVQSHMSSHSSHSIIVLIKLTQHTAKHTIYSRTVGGSKCRSTLKYNFIIYPSGISFHTQLESFPLASSLLAQATYFSSPPPSFTPKSYMHCWYFVLNAGLPSFKLTRPRAMPLITPMDPTSTPRTTEKLIPKYKSKQMKAESDDT